MRRALCLGCFVLAACASNRDAVVIREAPRPSASAQRAAAQRPMAQAPGCLVPLDDAPDDDEGGLAVQGQRAEGHEIVVSGASDLPSGPARANAPWRETAGHTFAPVLPVLGECLRPLCAPARHRMRLSVSAEGLVQLRGRQEFPLPTAVGRCVEGALAAVHVETPPPRTLPVDLMVSVSRAAL